MDHDAQWQVIYAALWASGVYDDPADAARKTDEVIANRPSVSFMGPEQETFDSRPVKWRTATEVSEEMEELIDKGRVVEEPPLSFWEKVKGWFYVEETETETTESVEGIDEAAAREGPPPAGPEQSAVEGDSLPAEEEAP